MIFVFVFYFHFLNKVICNGNHINDLVTDTKNKVFSNVMLIILYVIRNNDILSFSYNHHKFLLFYFNDLMLLTI